MTDKQGQFFNHTDHQYPQELIINPPYHVRQEINQIISTLEKKRKTELVVDFGAGSGRVTIPLLKQGWRVLAVDLSQKSLSNLNQLAHELKLVRLKTSASLPSLPQAAAIVGADVLHHLDIRPYLKLFYDHLASDGLICFSEPNYWNLSWHLYLRLASSWQIESGIKQCTYPNLRSALELAGFSDILLIPYGVIPLPLLNWSPWLYRLNIWLSRLPVIRLLSYRIIVCARKGPRNRPSKALHHH